ncbi:DoxX family protein [Paenibacillus sp. GCM10027626]|uniref:DoxX family protein n=1 Tax=Paenibacillus sp. GCM10027626 TaxID=3273411 RepID=UPI0036445DF6
MNKLSFVTTIMRVVLGIIFLAHGFDKFQMGLGNVSGWFDSMGVPGFFAYIAAVLELVGGIMLIIGLFSRYVSTLFVIMLISAIFMMKLSAGLLGGAEGAGYELDLGLMMVALYLVVAEPSPLSVDYLLRRKHTTK